MSDDLEFGSTVRGFIPEQKVFGRYVLRKILGRGGMGVVWLARDEELEREIAIKFLPEVVASDKQSIKDLKRETRRSLELTHPHIIRIYDFVQDSTGAGISMEYVAGDTLASLKVDQPNGHFEVTQLEAWLTQLCRALDYAHNKAKVVHRDLKPANVMIDEQGDLKIADFGIAASVSDSVSRVSNQAGSSGTPVYMSPQQMMGEDPDPLDDIYALGATLFELLTSKPPFFSGNVMMQVMNKQPPTMAARRAQLEVAGDEIPAVWEEVIASCLSKEREDRPSSVAEVLERLTGTKIGRSARSTIRPTGSPSASTGAPSQPSQPSQPTADPGTAPPATSHQPLTPVAPEVPTARPKTDASASPPPATPPVTSSKKGKKGLVIGLVGAALAAVLLVTLVGVPAYREYLETKRIAAELLEEREAKAAEERAAVLAETQAALGLNPEPEVLSTASSDPSLDPALSATTGAVTPDRPVEGQAWTIPDLGIEIMPIAAGAFIIGSPGTEDGRYSDEPQTQAVISEPYWLGRTEVTIGQWRELMGEGILSLGEEAVASDVLINFGEDNLTLAERWNYDPAESEISEIVRTSGDDLPVHFVSWRQAMSFVDALNSREAAAGRLPDGFRYALPTELQWEYAARAGRAEATYNGTYELLGTNNAPVLDDIAWYGGNSGQDYGGGGWGSSNWREKQYDHSRAGPRNVATKEANPWGLHDMLGNVSEWMFDRYDEFDTGVLENAIGATEGLARVHRGGSWFSIARQVRAAYRDFDDPDFRDKDVGFRVALIREEIWQRMARQERQARLSDEATLAARVEARAAFQFEGQFTVPDLEITMVEIAKGSFGMGSPDGESGRRENEVQRDVTISDSYWMGESEVTQGQWNQLMGNNPSAFPGLGDQAPVENVSYTDAERFIARLNEREAEAGRLPEGYAYALPTEAEWEYAARAGSTSAYPWGNGPGEGLANFENAPGSSEDGNVAAFNRRNGPIASTMPVENFEPNAWGLYDMHGNVWEWCRDAFKPYDTRATVDPWVRDSGSGDRVYRGGSWYHAARYSRSAARSHGASDYKSNFLGFRLALVKQPAG